MIKNKIPYTEFKTSLFSDAHKYDAFKESIEVVFNVEGAQKYESFDGLIRTFLISELLLIECTTSAPQSFARTNSMIARDGLDHFMIQLFHTGRTQALKTKDELLCEVGKILVLDTSKPWEAFNSDFNNLSLVIPRRLLAPHLTDIDAHHGRLLDPQKNAFAKLLYEYMISMQYSVREMEAQDAYSLVRPSLDLVSTALNVDQRGQGQVRPDDISHHYAQQFQIRRYIETNLFDPELSLQKIAHQFNLSRSYIYRLFPKSSGGVMAYARERRMQLALRRLLMPHSLQETVAQVAYSVGFESESSFARAFKSHFGVSPRQARVEKYGIPYKMTDTEMVAARIWEKWYREL